MKRIFSTLSMSLLLAGVGMLNDIKAQDIIVTKAGGTIEASVQEISEDSVTYKEFGDQQGPSFRIPTQKIVSIRLENGTEKVFSRTVADLPLAFVHGDVVTAGGRKLSEYELDEIFGPDLYDSVKGGMRMRNVGKGLLIPGAICLGASLAFVIAGSVEANADMVLAGSVLTVFGVPLTAAGVPLYCVGKGRAKRAVSEYNAMYGHREVSFNVGPTRNGFGVYLSF